MKRKELLDVLNLSTFTAFDFETTGLDPNNDKIIEIAAIRFMHGEIVDRFVSLVNPEIDIPHLITEITGISNAMVFKSPKEAEIVDSFLNFCSIESENILRKWKGSLTKLLLSAKISIMTSH